MSDVLRDLKKNHKNVVKYFSPLRKELSKSHFFVLPLLPMGNEAVDFSGAPWSELSNKTLGKFKALAVYEKIDRELIPLLSPYLEWEEIHSAEKPLASLNIDSVELSKRLATIQEITERYIKHTDDNRSGFEVILNFLQSLANFLIYIVSFGKKKCFFESSKYPLSLLSTLLQKINKALQELSTIPDKEEIKIPNHFNVPPNNIGFFEKISAEVFRKEKLISWISNTNWEEHPANKERSLKLIKLIQTSKSPNLLKILEQEATAIPNLSGKKSQDEDTLYFDSIERIFTHYTWCFSPRESIKQTIKIDKPWRKEKPSNTQSNERYTNAKEHLINFLKEAIWDDAKNLERSIQFIKDISSIDANKICSENGFNKYLCRTEIAYKLHLEIEALSNQYLSPNFPTTHNEHSRYYEFLTRAQRSYSMELNPQLMICSSKASPQTLKEYEIYDKYKENYEPTSRGPGL